MLGIRRHLRGAASKTHPLMIYLGNRGDGGLPHGSDRC